MQTGLFDIKGKRPSAKEIQEILSYVRGVRFLGLKRAKLNLQYASRTDLLIASQCLSNRGYVLSIGEQPSTFTGTFILTLMVVIPALYLLLSRRSDAAVLQLFLALAPIAISSGDIWKDLEVHAFIVPYVLLGGLYVYGGWFAIMTGNGATMGLAGILLALMMVIRQLLKHIKHIGQK